MKKGWIYRNGKPEEIYYKVDISTENGWHTLWELNADGSLKAQLDYVDVIFDSLQDLVEVMTKECIVDLEREKRDFQERITMLHSKMASVQQYNPNKNNNYFYG